MGFDGGNYAQAAALKGQAAASKATGRVAMAQAKGAAAGHQGKAARIEAENKVAGQIAVDNLSRHAEQRTKAQGSVRAVRAASGITAEGSGSQAEISLLKQFEQQSQDMAYSRSLQDVGARFTSTMERRAGDIALMGGEMERDYNFAQANIYNMQARNANRAGNLNVGMSAAGAIIGGAFGNPMLGMQIGQGMASMYNRGQVGTAESEGRANEYAEQQFSQFAGQMMSNWLS